jgi:hypothetical protein
MYMSYRPLISYDLGHRTAQEPHISWRHTGAIDRYWYVYHVSLDEFRCFSKRYPSYALRKHMCGSAGCEGGGLGKPKTYTWSGTFILKDGRYTFFGLATNILYSFLTSPKRASVPIVHVFDQCTAYRIINIALYVHPLTLGSGPLCTVRQQWRFLSEVRNGCQTFPIILNKHIAWGCQ